ncbi:cobalamin B12-binding domain-containing protein [Chloroflexota bacterium]
MEKKNPIKVLIAKPGLDGHDKGAKIITLGLRDEGMEVIYSDIRQTPEEIVEAALQEDVDVIGLSSLSGAHNYYFPRVIELVGQKGMNRVLVIGGGMIPSGDIPLLKEKGVREIFGPGTKIRDVATYIKENIESAN